LEFHSSLELVGFDEEVFRIRPELTPAVPDFQAIASCCDESGS
jgi:hypothetical protein